VFDLQKMEAAWEVPYDTGVNPIAIENNPDGSGRRIFVNLGALNSFSVVDFATHKEVARIKAPDSPTGFGGGRGCESNAHGIGISPDQKTLWVNSRPSNSVFAYSLPDIKLLGHVSLPEQAVPGKPSRSGNPAWITFTPDSKTVYVSSCGVKMVTAIDVHAMKEAARIPVGEMPDGWMGLDIGPETVRRFSAEIAGAKTIVWNGPMGVFEMPAFAQARWKSPKPSLARPPGERPRSSGAAIPWQRCSRQALPIKCRTSRPAEAPHSNFSPARNCRA